MIKFSGWKRQKKNRKTNHIIKNTMKTIKDFEIYIGQLLNNPNVDSKILEKIPEIQLILTAYILGLQGKDIFPSMLYEKMQLKDVPEQYHAMLAKLAILKSGVWSPITGPLVKELEFTLADFKNYFILK